MPRYIVVSRLNGTGKVKVAQNIIEAVQLLCTETLLPMTFSVPQFDDLPPVEGMPQGCAWGIFDKDGEKDVYGTLNLLTPDVVKAAAEEVQKGISISLK